MLSFLWVKLALTNPSDTSFMTVFMIDDGEGNGTPLQYSCLENPMDGGSWQAAVQGVAKSRAGLSDFTFSFHFPALEKEMATHSGVLAWRIPGTGEPGGLPSMGLHRVGHNWSDLAVAWLMKYDILNYLKIVWMWRIFKHHFYFLLLALSISMSCLECLSLGDKVREKMQVWYDWIFKDITDFCMVALYNLNSFTAKRYVVFHLHIHKSISCIWLELVSVNLL